MLSNQAVGVEDELLGGALVEIPVTPGRLGQRDDLDIHRLGDLYFVVQDRLISWRLYRMTGHCPVVKTCDLAQPSPMRMLRLPLLAASSTPPGSSVTYRPGIPIAPAGAGELHQRVEYRRRRLGPAASPWPRASKPTQSTAAVDLRLADYLSICSAMACGRDVHRLAAELRA